MKKLDRFEEVAIVALGLLALAGVMSGCGAIAAEMEDTSPIDSGGGGGGGRVGGRENDTVAPAVGEDVGRRLELLLENLGKRTAEDFTISFYPSEDDEITPDDLWLATYFPEPIAPGESERLQLRGLNAKQELPHGSVWIGAIIDGVGDLAECNEENNVASVPVVLGCRDLAPASLELFGDAGPARATRPVTGSRQR